MTRLISIVFIILFSSASFASDDELYDLPPSYGNNLPVYETVVGPDGKTYMEIMEPIPNVIPSPRPDYVPPKNKKVSPSGLLKRKFKDLNFNTAPICGCKTCYLNDGFGSRKSPTSGASSMHRGRDITAPNGVAVVAIESGFIFVRRKDPGVGYGAQLEIEHTDVYSSRYAHLSKVVRSSGYVEKGEKIGEIGSSGASTGPHLHFEVIQYGKNTTWITPKNGSGRKKGQKNGDKEKANADGKGRYSSPTKIDPDMFMNLPKKHMRLSDNKRKKKNTSAKYFAGSCGFASQKNKGAGSNQDESSAGAIN